jgi:hypothetical protein
MQLVALHLYRLKIESQQATLTPSSATAILFLDHLPFPPQRAISLSSTTMLANFAAPIDRPSTTQKHRTSSRPGPNAPPQPSSSKGTTTTANNSVLARTAISLEYASLINTGHCPLGIYVVPSTSSLFVWDAVFFVHQGAY